MHDGLPADDPPVVELIRLDLPDQTALAD